MRIIKPTGVIIAKKMIPMTMGATIFPSIRPNLNQILLGVCNRFAFVKLIISIITAFVILGLGYEFLLLWVLPSRIGLALVGFVFVFLPHHPADISAHDNKYQASTVRQGWEWILTPLMVFQNYHLIHHLYPNVPFYNYLKIWHLRYDELTSKEPALQTAFGLKPVNRKYS